MQNDEMVLDQPDIQPEIELEEENEEHSQPQNSDPLDEIQDVDTLRAEAKKLRAIAQRNKKSEPKVEKPIEKPQTSSGDYLRKSDFELANQKKAIHLATTSSELDSEEVKAQKDEMLDNWEQVKQFYTPRRGKATAEDVLEDIKDAYILFKARVKPTSKPDTTGLVETKATGTGVTPETPKKGPELKNLKLPTKPEEWYGDKSK